jgi:hypothetical protein
MARELCSWCGEPVVPDDGYRLGEQAGERRAAFCRLEHVVPWVIQGAHWDPGTIEVPADPEALAHCARCGAALDDARVVLVRHRGQHRVTDAFCGMPHLLEWARAGGRWG